MWSKLILICLIAFYTGKILYNIKQQRIEGFKVDKIQKIHVITGSKELLNTTKYQGYKF